MSPYQRLLASPRRQKFFGHIRATTVLPHHHLIRVVQAAHQYSPLMRVAALRILIANAPVEVTKGRCYLERRRLVRTHYGV